MYHGWQTVRIFISSTFLDMHPERDYLVQVVFPELRRRCAERRLHLVELDLRWGITEAEAHRGDAVQICLDEIDRSRPFFIALLGERYGWVPKQLKVEPGPKTRWLRKKAAGLSVTAMEIYHGVLNNPEMANHAFFYRRDPAFKQDVPDRLRKRFEVENDEAKRRLSDLVAMIGERFKEYHPRYGGLYNGNVTLTGLEAFGQQVLEDLWGAIAARYPAEPVAAADPLLRSGSYHAAFLEERARRFIGRKNLLARLRRYASAHRTKPLIVTGPPGAGKSSLLARFASDYSRANPGAIVISHFTGCSPNSTQPEQIRRRLRLEVNRALGLPHTPSPAESVAQLFPEFGEQGAPKPVLLLVDAVDQIDSDDALSWIPGRLPNGVHMVLSCLPGKRLNDLRRRLQLRELAVPELTAAEQRMLVDRQLNTFRKELDPSQLALLLSKPGMSSPLFAAVACEELRLFGNFKRLTARIGRLPASVPELFAQVLARVERMPRKKALVADALSLIRSARGGLLESELLDLMGDGNTRLAPARWASMYQALRAYLRPPGEEGDGLIDFFHGQLAEAVRLRYLGSATAVRRCHGRLADYFRRRADPGPDGTWQGTDPRCLEALPFHLLHGGRYPELASLLCDFGYIEARLRTGTGDSLDQDYDEALRLATFSRKDRQRVAEFARFLLAHWSMLIDNPEPDLLSQLALNQPEWSALAKAAEARVTGHRLRWTDKPASLEPRLVAVPGGMAADFSPDGQQLLISTSHGTLELRDAETGTRLQVLQGPQTWFAVCRFTPDGRRALAWSADEGLYLWDLGEEGSLIRFPTDDRAHFACSADGRRLAINDHQYGLRLHDLETGAAVAKLAKASGWTFTPDGKQLYVVWGDEALRVERIDPLTGRREGLVAELPGYRYCHDLTCSPDGRQLTCVTESHRVLLGTDGSIIRTYPRKDEWDGSATAKRATLPPKSPDTHHGAYSPDERLFATVGSDQLTLYDLESNRSVSVPHVAEYFHRVRFSPDGSRIAAGGKGATQLWDVAALCQRMRPVPEQTEQAVAPDGTPVAKATLTPCGRMLVCERGEDSLDLWDAGTGEYLCTLNGTGLAWDFYALAPDRSMLVTGRKEGVVARWSLSTGAYLNGWQLPDGLRVCAYSTDEVWFLMANPHALVLVDMAGNQVSECELAERATEAITSCYFLRDDTGVGGTAGEGESAFMWAWHPESGSQFAMATPDDAMRECVATEMNIMSVATPAGVGAQPASMLPDSPPGVTSWCLSPDGAKVLLGFGDGRVSLRTVGSGAELAARQLLRPYEEIEQAVTLPGGDVAAIISAAPSFSVGGRAVHLFDIGTRERLMAPLDWTGVLATGGTVWAALGAGKQILLHDGRSGASRWLDEPDHTAVAFSPDLLTLAVAGGGEAVRVYSPETGEVIRTLQHPNGVAVGELAWSPDSRWIATGSASGVVVWDARSGELRFRWRGESTVARACFTGVSTLRATLADGTDISLAMVDTPGCR